EVDSPIPRRVEEIRRMAQEHAELRGWHRARIDGGPPGSGGSADRDVRFSDDDRHPSTFQHDKSGSSELAHHIARLVYLIVVPKHRELSQSRLERPEHRLDPSDRIVVFDEIASNQEQVRAPWPAGIDDRLEEHPSEARSEVKVAKLHDL